MKARIVKILLILVAMMSVYFYDRSRELPMNVGFSKTKVETRESVDHRPQASKRATHQSVRGDKQKSANNGEKDVDFAYSHKSSRNDVEGIFKIVAQGDLAALEKEISAGINLDQRDSQGNPLVFVAVDNGQLQAARLLLSKGANGLITNKRGVHLATLAALQFDRDLYEELVERGAPKNPSVLGKMNLLMSVAMEGSASMSSAILKRASEDVNLQDEFGNTALHYAAQGGHSQVVELLLKFRAKAKIKNEEGKTPLDIAREGRFQGVLQQLQHL